MTTDIFLAESPLQCINAAEAAFILSKASQKILFVRLNESESNNQQIKLACDIFKWDMIFFQKIENNSGIRKLVSFYSFSSFVISKLANKSIDKLFFGDFRSYWMECIRTHYRKHPQIMLDDGDISISIVENFLKNNIKFYNTGTLSFLRRLRYSIFCNIESTVYLFSSFKINCYDHVFENKYTYLKSKSANNGISEFNVSNKSILFFGSRYSEEGILSLEKEIDLLKIYSSYLKNNYEKIYYVPHRGDSETKLKAVADFMEIKRFGMPAELYLATTNEVFTAIAGCCTSALNNLYNIFKYEVVISFMLPLNDIDQKYRHDFILTYESYRKIGFKIIEQ